MGLLWNITCRRLRSRGTLVQYAEGAPLSAKDRAAVEAHMAACPTCTAEVEELRAVGALLRKNTPTLPAGSLAARGELWSVLESKIAQTPQDRADSWSNEGPRAPSPRLDRLGYLLSMPRSAPFAAAVGVSVVFVGAVVLFGHHSVQPAAPVHMASAAAAKPSDSAEIILAPSPYNVASAATSVKSTFAGGAGSGSSAPAAMAGAVSHAAPAAIADRVVASAAGELEGKTAAHNSVARAVHAPPHPIIVASVATEARTASSTAFGVAGVTGAGSDRSASGAMGLPQGLNKKRRDDRALKVPMLASAPMPPAPPTMSVEVPRPTPTPFAVAALGGARAISDDGMATAADMASASPAPTVSGDEPQGEVQDVPDVHASVDVAIELRRQRSLFSYATR